MAIDKRKLIGGGIIATSVFLLAGGSTSDYIPSFLSGGGGSDRSVEASSPLYNEDTQDTPTEPKVNFKLDTGDAFLDRIILEDASKYPDRSYSYNAKTGITKIADASGKTIGGFDSVNLQSITHERAEATYNNPITNILNRSSGGSSARSSGGGSSSSSTPKTSSKVSISKAKDPVVRDYENKNLVSTTKTASQIKTENKISSLFGGR